MIRRWWLCWAGMAMFAVMLVMGFSDLGLQTGECGGGENPQDLMFFLGAPGALLAVAFGLLWARLYRNLHKQPMRAFGLIATLLGGLSGLAVPLLAIVLLAESTTLA